MTHRSASRQELQEAQHQAESATAQTQRVKHPRLEAQHQLRGCVPRGAAEDAQAWGGHCKTQGVFRLLQLVLLRSANPKAFAGQVLWWPGRLGIMCLGLFPHPSPLGCEGAWLRLCRPRGLMRLKLNLQREGWGRSARSEQGSAISLCTRPSL